MITGHAPFHELNVMQAMLKIAQGHRPSRPSDSEQLSQALSDDLWSLMNACWMQEAESRPPMSDVLGSLGVVMRGVNDQCQPTASPSPPIPSASDLTWRMEFSQSKVRAPTRVRPPLPSAFNILPQPLEEPSPAMQSLLDSFACRHWFAH
jgi:hypothetical protein